MLVQALSVNTLPHNGLVNQFKAGMQDTSSKIIRKAIKGVKSIHRSQYELAQNRPRDAPVLSSAGILLQQFMVARKF